MVRKTIAENTERIASRLAAQFSGVQHIDHDARSKAERLARWEASDFAWRLAEHMGRYLTGCQKPIVLPL